MRLTVVIDPLEELLAGRSWQRRTTAASRRSRIPTSCWRPDLPRNRKRTCVPLTVAWRFLSVVSPNDRLSRAYSSLPTRISVVSSSRTTAASTFSRDSPGVARSASQRARTRGRTRAKSMSRSNFALSRPDRQHSW